jgi:hypothetical protein
VEHSINAFTSLGCFVGSIINATLADPKFHSFDIASSRVPIQMSTKLAFGSVHIGMMLYDLKYSAAISETATASAIWSIIFPSGASGPSLSDCLIRLFFSNSNIGKSPTHIPSGPRRIAAMPVRATS